MLAAWREAPFYAPRERAALAWCESLTLLPETGAADADYEEAAAQFSPLELVSLTTAIVAINGWNRFAVGFRTPVDGGNTMNGRAARPIPPDDETHHLAQVVRETCLQAALDSYERAGLSGMCAEGRWEMAIDAIRALDLGRVVAGSPPL